MTIKDDLRVELCSRSGFTQKIGVGSIPDLVKDAKSKNIGVLCLADFYTTAGFYQFEKECKSSGIIPLFGSTINVEFNGHILSTVVIARNKAGIADLNKLISELQGRPYDYSDISTLVRNLLIIPIVEEDVTDIINDLNMFDYIGITNGEDDIFQSLIKYVNPSRIVELGNSHFVKKCKNDINDKNEKAVLKYQKLKSFKEFNYSNEDNFKKFVLDNPKCVLSTIENISVLNRAHFYPEPMFSFDKLEKYVFNEARNIYHPFSQKIEDRIQDELMDLKRNNGWIILTIYHKLCIFLRNYDQHYYVRGNGSSSIICYLLGISNIDPIKYGLYYQTLFSDKKINNLEISISPKFRFVLEDWLSDVVGDDNIACPSLSSLFDKKDIYGTTLFNIHKESQDNSFLTELQPCDLTHTIKDKHKIPHEYFIKKSEDSFYETTALISCGKGPFKTTDSENVDLSDSFCKIIVLDDQLLDKVFNIVNKYGYPSDWLNNNYIKSFVNHCDDSLMKPLLEQIQPQTYEELTKVIAILHGTDVWFNNQESLFISDHNLSNIIATREDAIDYFLAHGMPFNETLQAVENIQKGKGKNNIYKSEYQIDSRMQKVFNAIKYLPPRGLILEKTRCQLICALDNKTDIGE